jgi:hypothetical protein
MHTSNRSACHPCSNRVSATSRTAVYGPVRTVVWEGRRCEAPPYPDLWHFSAIRSERGDVCSERGDVCSYGKSGPGQGVIRLLFFAPQQTSVLGVAQLIGVCADGGSNS